MQEYVIISFLIECLGFSSKMYFRPGLVFQGLDIWPRVNLYDCKVYSVLTVLSSGICRSKESTSRSIWWLVTHIIPTG